MRTGILLNCQSHNKKERKNLSFYIIPLYFRAVLRGLVSEMKAQVYLAIPCSEMRYRRRCFLRRSPFCRDFRRRRRPSKPHRAARRGYPDKSVWGGFAYRNI